MRSETAWSSPAPWPADKRLYLVTPVRPDFAAFLQAAVRGGVDVVQVRERSLPDGPLLEALAEAREVARAAQVVDRERDRQDQQHHDKPVGADERPDPLGGGRTGWDAGGFHCRM